MTKLRDLVFFKQKAAYEYGVRLVGSGRCIRDSMDMGRRFNSLRGNTASKQGRERGYFSIWNTFGIKGW